MAKLLCPNVTEEQNNYSAPVPMVGYYIAAATIVCFLLMICDLIRGFFLTKFWIPCRSFSLNSVTLSLLSITTKLPVDLTTSMPSAYDQMSKLTSTTLICVSMGFLLPSLGTNKASVCMENMIALTILVVTIIINMCMQISTGVIFSFIPEHVIILFCMLTTMIFLWAATWGINHQKEVRTDRKQDFFAKGKGSMLERLELCYLHGYTSDPQFVLCDAPVSYFTIAVCLICLIVVIQVTVRIFIVHEYAFCHRLNGPSDYGSSTRVIAFTQFFTILLASLATSFRCQVLIKNDISSKYFSYFRDNEIFQVITSNNPFLKADRRDHLDTYLRKAMLLVYGILTSVLILPCLVFTCMCFCILYVLDLKSLFMRGIQLEGIQEYRKLLRENNIVLAEWTLTKCVEDIKRWNVIKIENSPTNLLHLLSKTCPSEESIEELNSHYGFKEGNEVSCLYLVFLARLASVSTPHTLSSHLTRSLGEVFDIILFIDTKKNSLWLNNRRKCKLAKAMWMGEDFSIAVPASVKRLMNEPSQSENNLYVARKIIFDLKKALPYRFIWDELQFIMDFINGKECNTVEELYSHMERLFVDMVHIFLSQLPVAIFKEVMESQVEDYEEKVGPMLKFLCQVESLDGTIQWSFPIASNITCLTTSPESITNNQDSTTPDNNDSDDVSIQVIEDDDQNVCNDQDNEIIQVEC